MPGSPQKRAIHERDAIKRIEITGRLKADEKTRSLTTARIRFSRELSEQITILVASGVPIEDSVLNGVTIAPGIASRLGFHPRTFWEWQQQFPEFGQCIARARVESANRIADRMLALADAAPAEPALANSVRVAADILKWQAAVRNPRIYGDRQRIEFDLSNDLGEKLRQARQRTMEHNKAQLAVALPAINSEKN